MKFKFIFESISSPYFYLSNWLKELKELEALDCKSYWFYSKLNFMRPCTSRNWKEKTTSLTELVANTCNCWNVESL